jgi:hypothetical protein
MGHSSKHIGLVRPKWTFAAQEDAVRTRLAKYENVHIYRGFFPSTAHPVRDRQFALVHIDVDTNAGYRRRAFQPMRVNPSGRRHRDTSRSRGIVTFGKKRLPRRALNDRFTSTPAGQK